MKYTTRRLGRPRKQHGYRSAFVILVATFVMMLVVLWFQDRVKVQPTIVFASDIINSYKVVHSAQMESSAEAKVQQKDERINFLEQNFEELLRNPIKVTQRQFLEREILPRTRKEGLPDNLAAAQWAIESNRGVYRPGHNYWGLMQWDKKGNRSLMSCPTLDECVHIYATTVKSILSRKGMTFDSKEDAVQILTKLQTGTPRYEGDEKDPMYYVRLVSGLDEFKYYSK